MTEFPSLASAFIFVWQVCLSCRLYNYTGILECYIYFWVSMSLTSWLVWTITTFRDTCKPSQPMPGQSLEALIIIVHAHGCLFLVVTIFNKLQTHEDSSPREGQLCLKLVSLLKQSGSLRTVHPLDLAPLPKTLWVLSLLQSTHGQLQSEANFSNSIVLSHEMPFYLFIIILCFFCFLFFARNT